VLPRELKTDDEKYLPGNAPPVFDAEAPASRWSA